MTTDPQIGRQILTEQAYRDGSKLAVRQSMYQRWQRPRIDLPGHVVAALSDAAGVIVDVGSGNRHFLARLGQERPDLRLLGLDLAMGMRPDAVADAQQLPVADAAAGGVLALHMLYYVPDIQRALREFRRVLRSGGILIAATNGYAHNAEIRSLWHDAVAAVAGADIGFSADPVSRFPLETGAQVIGRVFGQVERRDYRAWVEIPSADAVAAYLTSSKDTRAAGLPPGRSWESALAAAHERADAIVRRHGVFLATTHTGIFVCR
jgi:ubiquinone/menaquinone biosynthesis C-methylase UbiE